MARRRRRTSRRQRKQRRMAYINIALVVSAIAIVGWLFWSLQPAPYDEMTLCEITDELPPHTAVIVDKTDEYTEEEAGFIRTGIERARDRLEIGERFTLFELDERGEFNPRGELTLCNPGRGNQVNPLFNNPKMIQERFDEKFEAPLQAALEDLVQPKEAPSSPIMESLARLALTEAFSEEAPQRRLLIFSDMLQNSSLFTAYGGVAGALPESMPSAADVAESVRTRYGEGLSGVQIEIRLIPREGRADLQRGPLRAYWDEIFRDLGATVVWRDL